MCFISHFMPISVYNLLPNHDLLNGITDNNSDLYTIHFRYYFPMRMK